MDWVLFLVIGFIIGWMSTTGAKSQLIRLVDILLFGPFMIWVGLREDNFWIRALLIMLGSGTMAYNLKNYLSERDD